MPAVIVAAGKTPTAAYGLLVFLFLAVGCYLLFWSMSHHLRKVPKAFSGEQDGASPAAGSDSARAGRSRPSGQRPAGFGGEAALGSGGEAAPGSGGEAAQGSGGEAVAGPRGEAVPGPRGEPTGGAWAPPDRSSER